MTAAAIPRILTAQVPVAPAAAVDTLSGQLERLKQWIVRSTLIAYVAREKETRRIIQEGRNDMDAGRVIPMEHAEAWADMPLPATCLDYRGAGVR